MRILTPRSRAAVTAAVLMVLSVALAAVAAAPARAADEKISVSAVRSSSGLVSLVAQVDPAPVAALGVPDVAARANGTDLMPVQVASLLSDQTAIGVVVDASAAGATAMSTGGQAGVAGFLLQVPPAATTVVVADRSPAAVLSGPSPGVSDDLTAVSAVRGSGARDTSNALTLALKRLPAWPTRYPVLVLYTAAPDAGGETADALAARLQQQHAVLAVVSTGPASPYWQQVAAATGGLAVQSTPIRSIKAFDRIADGLGSRYAISFAQPPAGSEVDLRIDSVHTTVTAPTPAPAPATTAGPTAGSTLPPASGGGGSGSGLFVALGVFAVLVLALIAGLVLLLVRRRQPADPRAAGPAEPGATAAEVLDAERPAVEIRPGVKMYEVPDLFEPRSIRDARDARDANDAHETRDEDANGHR